MPDAAALQTNFLGGELSPYFQGRAEDPRYKTGLNVCLNTIPVEEGTAARRPGTAFAATTRNGNPGKLLRFDFEVEAPYNAEFTDGHIRFFAGISLVLDAAPPHVLGLSAANPCVVETAEPHGWTTADQVEFLLPVGQVAWLGMTPLLTRQFSITVLSAYTFSISDPITGIGVDGATLALGSNELLVGRVVDIPTPYTAGQWAQARLVQNSVEALVLVPGFPPYVLTSAFTTSSVFASFAFTPAVFLDGPYLDPPTDGTTATPGSLAGSVTFTFSSPASINSGIGFVASDVGRPMRFFSEPAAWNAVTVYALNDTVKFRGGYYQCILVGVAGLEPDLNVNNWAIDTLAAVWTWGNITTVSGATQVVVSLAPASVDLAGNPRADGPLLYTTSIASWQLGAWSVTSGYPTCGTYYEGRFYLMGAISNRFDATKSNELLRFDPTGQDGTVADNCGIAETLNSDNLEPILWGLPTAVGVVMGTKAGEWLLQASSLGDPLTPTSIQAHRVTKFGCENIEPIQAQLSLVFVQRYGRKVIEYIADVYSGKFSGTNLSLTAKHLSAPGILEIAYQKELAPVLWARCADGSLIGCTYKRESPFGTQPASFSGWHRHMLGSGRLVESIQVGPSIGGDLDALMMITNDPATNIRFVEMLTDIFDEDNTIFQSWFVDEAIVPKFSQLTLDGLGVNLYGYWPLIGTTVSVFAGGLDCGDFLVQAGGLIYVPFGSDPDEQFTAAYLATLNAMNIDFFPVAAGVSPGAPTGGHAPPTPTVVQSYLYSGESTSGFGPVGMVDFVGGRLFQNGDSFLTAYDLPTGAMLYQVALGSLPGGSVFQAYYGAGKIIYVDSANDLNALHVLDATNFSPLYTTGSNGSFMSGFWRTPAITGFYYPFSACVVSGGGYDLFLSTTQFGQLSVVSLGTTEAVFLYSVSGLVRGSPICAGQQTPDFASAYAIDTGGGAPSPSALTLHRFSVWNVATTAAAPFWSAAITYHAGDVVNGQGSYWVSLTTNMNKEPDSNPGDWELTIAPGMRLEVVQSYVPTDIDPTWTNFDGGQPGAIVYDETDGNIITSFGTLDSVTIPQYLVKLDAATGTILWKTPNLHCPDSTSRAGRGHITIAKIISGSNWSYNYVKTADGTYTTVTGTGLTPNVFQACDDVRGLFVNDGQYLASGATIQPAAGVPSSWSYRWSSLPSGVGPTLAPPENVPIVVGYTYTSQGQLLRAIDPREAGAQTGPALGMSRRSHMFGTLLHSTQGISFGTDFTKLHPANFKTKGGTSYLWSQRYSGVYWNTVDADYSFDDMLCWQITRPYSANVLSFVGFRQTQDR